MDVLLFFCKRDYTIVSVRWLKLPYPFKTESEVVMYRKLGFALCFTVLSFWAIACFWLRSTTRDIFAGVTAKNQEIADLRDEIKRLSVSAPVELANEVLPHEADDSPELHSRVSEIEAFSELPMRKGDRLCYFVVRTADQDGSVRRVVVKVRSSLIEDWAKKTIKNSMSW